MFHNLQEVDAERKISAQHTYTLRVVTCKANETKRLMVLRVHEDGFKQANALDSPAVV